MTPKKSIVLTAVLALAAAAVASLQPPAGGSGPKTPPPSKPDDKLEITGQAMPQASPLGPEHKRLEKLAGLWAVTTKMEMKGMPPSESAEMCTLKSALGGRFIHETGGGTMGPEKVESFKLWGYNTGSKQYEGVWTWTLSTGLLHVTGAGAEDGKVIKWDAWYNDDHTGKKNEFKITTTFTDEDHFTVVINGGKMDDGTEGPTLTSVYTRKK